MTNVKSIYHKSFFNITLFYKNHNSNYNMSEADIMKFKNWFSNPDMDVNWTTVAQQQKYRQDNLDLL